MVSRGRASDLPAPRSLQFLLAVDTEYFPLSLVRATCAVPVARKDGVHLKQRRGELPKATRWAACICSVARPCRFMGFL